MKRKLKQHKFYIAADIIENKIKSAIANSKEILKLLTGLKNNIRKHNDETAIRDLKKLEKLFDETWEILKETYSVEHKSTDRMKKEITEIERILRTYMLDKARAKTRVEKAEVELKHTYVHAGNLAHKMIGLTNSLHWDHGVIKTLIDTQNLGNAEQLSHSLIKSIKEIIKGLEDLFDEEEKIQKEYTTSIKLLKWTRTNHRKFMGAYKLREEFRDTLKAFEKFLEQKGTISDELNQRNLTYYRKILNDELSYPRVMRRDEERRARDALDWMRYKLRRG